LRGITCNQRKEEENCKT